MYLMFLLSTMPLVCVFYHESDRLPSLPRFSPSPPVYHAFHSLPSLLHFSPSPLSGRQRRRFSPSPLSTTLLAVSSVYHAFPSPPCLIRFSPSPCLPSVSLSVFHYAQLLCLGVSISMPVYNLFSSVYIIVYIDFFIYFLNLVHTTFIYFLVFNFCSHPNKGIFINQNVYPFPYIYALLQAQL